jgi:cob(I)alamin adenosyltransferase
MVPLVKDKETCDPGALAYVNRLSDYLFTAARYVNFCDGSDETQYKKATSSTQRERITVKLNET